MNLSVRWRTKGAFALTSLVTVWFLLIPLSSVTGIIVLMAPETVMAVLDTRLSGTDFAIDIREKLRPVYPQKIVMPGLEPGIHVPAFNDVGRSMQSWIAGSSPAMTVFGCGYHSNASTAQTVPDSRVLDTAYHVVGANDGDLFGGVDARLKAGHGVF